ncbi:MAG: DUF3320 domain-containing protein, partial [Planctomycetaceae bacterium]|nr:DUF3320 domain-containing protein [Planctomycetaceae bacterium]
DSLEEAKKHWEEVDKSEAESATAIQARVTIKGVDEDSFWQRVEVTEADSDGNASDVYQQATFRVRGFIGGPADLTTSQLAQLMQRIVDVESPVHTDEIGRRCITILGQGRLVASLKQKVVSAAAQLQQQGLVVHRGDFVYTKEQSYFPVRNRRELDNANLRKVSYIAPEELRAAVLTVITEHIGTDEAETMSSVAKMLGVSNSQPFQNAVRSAIASLTQEHAIEERAGKLFVGG